MSTTRETIRVSDMLETVFDIGRDADSQTSRMSARAAMNIVRANQTMLPEPIPSTKASRRSQMIAAELEGEQLYRRPMIKVRPALTRRAATSSLICADAAGCARLIVAGIAAIGRASTLVHTPLDAIDRLQNAMIPIDSVFVSLQDSRFDIFGFFAFLKDEYPRIRRIAFARQGARSNAPVAAFCLHDTLLWDPWDRDDYAQILEDAIGDRRRSSGSDLQRFATRRDDDLQRA